MTCSRADRLTLPHRKAHPRLQPAAFSGEQIENRPMQRGDAIDDGEPQASVSRPATGLLHAGEGQFQPLHLIDGF